VASLLAPCPFLGMLIGLLEALDTLQGMTNHIQSVHRPLLAYTHSPRRCWTSFVRHVRIWKVHVVSLQAPCPLLGVQNGLHEALDTLQGVAVHIQSVHRPLLAYLTVPRGAGPVLRGM
jgi:hypothetical protein